MKVRIKLSFRARAVLKIIKKRFENHKNSYRLDEVEPVRVYQETRAFINYLYDCGLLDFYDMKLLEDCAEDEKCALSYLRELALINKEG